jgi:broad specificity phosphatase PhoE
VCWWGNGYGNDYREVDGDFLTQVIVIRHGRTEWNRVERFRGRANLELDEVGIKQAEATAERVVEWPVEAVYCSPLQRTLITASIIARRFGLDAEPLPGIIDINYGEWQGLTPEEAKAKDSSLYTKWLESPHIAEFPGGESLAVVRQRAASAVDGLLRRYPEGVIALVSHKVVCQILILHFLGLDNSHFWQIGQDVSAINVFEVDGGNAYASLLNDTCHLRKKGLV